MNLLFAQAVVNAPNESALMIVGVVACIGVFALLLKKRNSKSAA